MRGLRRLLRGRRADSREEARRSLVLQGGPIGALMEFETPSSFSGERILGVRGSTESRAPGEARRSQERSEGVAGRSQSGARHE